MISLDKTEFHLNKLNGCAAKQTYFSNFCTEVALYTLRTLYTSAYISNFKINLSKAVLYTKILCILCIDS